MCAASVGVAENVEWLYRAGCTVASTANDGSTALHLAVSSGSVSTVQLLLDHGSDINVISNDGITPFHKLFSVGNNDPYSSWPLSMFEIFLIHGADLESKEATGQTALRLLVQAWEASFDSFRFYDWTEMVHLAVKNIGLAGPLHDICTDPNLARTALLKGDEDLVRKFLEHSPDVNAIVEESSIIKTACTKGCSSSLLQDLLIRSNIFDNKEQGSGLVQIACEANGFRCRDIVQILLRTGLSPNDARLGTNESALMTAARHANIDVLKLLMSYGANLHALDMRSASVVHHACHGGHQASLQVLRDTEINWNQKANWTLNSEQVIGVNALHIAASLENNEVLEYLLNEDLVDDIDAVAGDSETSLFIAAWSSLPLNVSSLLSRKADATIRCFDQFPVHIAARLGYDAVVAVFLHHDCDIEVIDGDGLSCEILAFKFGHKHLAKTLREHREKRGKHLFVGLLY